MTTLPQTWKYDTDNHQWDMIGMDGHVWQDEHMRFKAYYDGSLVGVFISEEVAMHSVESKAGRGN